MIFSRINSKKLVQHGRIGVLRTIFESVCKAATITILFWDSIILSSVTIMALKQKTKKQFHFLANLFENYN